MEIKKNIKFNDFINSKNKIISYNDIDNAITNKEFADNDYYYEYNDSIVKKIDNAFTNYLIIKISIFIYLTLSKISILRSPIFDKKINIKKILYINALNIFNIISYLIICIIFMMTLINNSYILEINIEDKLFN